jgi:nucleotide-binding universal stress UspA family protein
MEARPWSPSEVSRKDKSEKTAVASEHDSDRPIIIAVDFSDDSKAALEWGLEEAALRRAPATILHVIHDPGETPGYYHRKKKKIMVPLTEAAEQLFDEYIEECSNEIPALKSTDELLVRRKLAKGIPVRRILEFSEKWDARMIVMGSRGQTGIKHLLMGSKAEQVVQLASIPVVIVKSPATKKSE